MVISQKQYTPDTNLNGEERAPCCHWGNERIPHGYTLHAATKACMANDIENGATWYLRGCPEDFALIDYANSSKIEAQAIIRMRWI